MTDLNEARTALRTFAEGGNPVGLRASCAVVLARLDELDTRPLPDSYTCQMCGAWVTDRVKHVDWHMALADVWRWVERVSGSSCEQARKLLGAP